MTADENYLGTVESAPRLSTPLCNADFPDTVGFEQVVLRSKTVFLSKRDIMMFAGNLEAAREVAKTLQLQLANGSKPQLDITLKQLANHSEINELQILLISLREQEVEFQRHNCLAQQVEGLTVFRGGSGCQMIQEPRFFLGQSRYERVISSRGDPALHFISTLMANLIESEYASANFASFRSGGFYEIHAVETEPDLKFKKMSYAYNFYSFPTAEEGGLMASLRYHALRDGGIIAPFAIDCGTLRTGNPFYVHPFFNGHNAVNARISFDANANDLSIDRFQHSPDSNQWKTHTTVSLGNTQKLGSEDGERFAIAWTEIGQQVLDSFMSRLSR